MDTPTLTEVLVMADPNGGEPPMVFEWNVVLGTERTTDRRTKQETERRVECEGPERLL